MESRQTSVVTSVGDDKIEVREATPGDYEGVLAISTNIYEGFDYLPGIYQAYINKQAANFYVLLKNDKIAAFKSFHIANSKQHFTSMAVRVAEEERGQGFMEILHKNALHLFCQKHPTMRKLMMTAIWHKGVQSYVSKSETGKVLVKRNILVYKLESAKNIISNFLDQHKNDPPEFLTKPLTPQEIPQYLKQAVIDDLMPEKMFMYGKYWLPEITDENVVQQIMENETDYVFSSFDKGTGELMSLSYGHYSKCPLGDRLDIFYHGNDLSDLVGHMTSHLRHLMDVVPDIINLGIMVYFPKSITAESLEESLSPIGQRETNGIFYVREYVIISEDLF